MCFRKVLRSRDKKLWRWLNVIHTRSLVLSFGQTGCRYILSECQCELEGVQTLKYEGLWLFSAFFHVSVSGIMHDAKR